MPEKRALFLLSPMLTDHVESRGCFPDSTVVGIDEGEA